MVVDIIWAKIAGGVWGLAPSFKINCFSQVTIWMLKQHPNISRCLPHTQGQGQALILGQAFFEASVQGGPPKSNMT